jgi:hypothetical protein
MLIVRMAGRHIRWTYGTDGLWREGDGQTIDRETDRQIDRREIQRQAHRWKDNQTNRETYRRRDGSQDRLGKVILNLRLG